eukprot:CAMPEP_0119006388 /NCGR_PEP_ID=MMETSP1176-20130426/2267_1 /TAXON_ID=265551 /ORGANISM="Synedropsis recta cf, Strain CCMP1620" /LENGTH=422 /DNA_ID=CAMNT_0006958297 /DNA_START=84 /DNA_END=1349 /DNA_ORIENTATION=-
MAAFYWTFLSVLFTLSAFYAGEWYGKHKITVENNDNSLRGSSVENGLAVVTEKKQSVVPIVKEEMTNGTAIVKEDKKVIAVVAKKEEKGDNTNLARVVPPSSALSSEEKMLAFFSGGNCRVSADAKPEKWLKQMVIQIGVQKGGTKAMHSFLEENPHFASRCTQEYATKELNFFNQHVDGIDVTGTIEQHALQTSYANLIKKDCPLAVEVLSDDPQKMYLDDSPLYMQDSDTIPQLLNCVVPSAKIMAVIRNPTDRAFSHFNFYLEYGSCVDKTFDEWVDLNIQDLKEAGVLDAKDPYDELMAWRHYNQVHDNDRKCRTFVTRGIYAIQLLHFMSGLKAAGRPTTDLFVLHSEDLKHEKRQPTYDRVVNFLGLDPHKLSHSASVHKTVYKKELHNSTRAKLDAFYQPYNQRLYKLLKWDPVW